MAPISELDEQHGVDLGAGYKNNRGCTAFAEFIGRDLQIALVSELSKCKFFGVQADTTTDAGNVEALHLNPSSTEGKVHVCLCIQYCLVITFVL